MVPDLIMFHTRGSSYWSSDATCWFDLPVSSWWFATNCKSQLGLGVGELFIFKFPLCRGRETRSEYLDLSVPFQCDLSIYNSTQVIGGIVF